MRRRHLEPNRYSKDLSASRTLRVTSALFLLWMALGLVIPAVLGGILTQSWAGVWTGLIWGGLIRIFLVHHVTWSVNSACQNCVGVSVKWHFAFLKTFQQLTFGLVSGLHEEY